MSDPWCKRLAVIVAVWAVLALTLELVISVTIR